MTLIPKNDVSKAVDCISIFSIAIDVEKMQEPGMGVWPALLDSTVTLPLLSFKKGTAREMI